MKIPKSITASILSIAASACGTNQHQPQPHKLQTAQIQGQVSCDSSIPGSLSEPEGIYNPFNHDPEQVCAAAKATNGKVAILIGSHGYLIGDCPEGQYGTCYLSGPLKDQAIRPSSLVAASQRSLFQGPVTTCPSVIKFQERRLVSFESSSNRPSQCPIAVTNYGNLGECTESQGVCYINGPYKGFRVHPESFLTNRLLFKRIDSQSVIIANKSYLSDLQVLHLPTTEFKQADFEAIVSLKFLHSLAFKNSSLSIENLESLFSHSYLNEVYIYGLEEIIGYDQPIPIPRHITLHFNRTSNYEVKNGHIVQKHSPEVFRLLQVEDLGLGHANTLINPNYFDTQLDRLIDNIDSPQERTYTELFNLKPEVPTASIFKDQSGETHSNMHVLTYPNSAVSSKAFSRLDAFTYGTKTHKAGQIPESNLKPSASNLSSTAIANFFNKAQELNIKLSGQELSILMYCLDNNILKLINGLVYPSSNMSLSFYTASGKAYWHISHILSQSMYVVNQEYRDFALKIWNELDSDQKRAVETCVQHLQFDSHGNEFTAHIIISHFISYLGHSNIYYNSQWTPAIYQFLEDYKALTPQSKLKLDYLRKLIEKHSPTTAVIPDITKIFKSNR